MFGGIRIFSNCHATLSLQTNKWSTKPTTGQVIQLDRTTVKVIGEMEDVLIRLSTDERVCQYMDIVVADILDAYGLVLSRDWSAKLEGYFASDWSHMWLPYKGC